MALPSHSCAIAQYADGNPGISVGEPRFYLLADRCNRGLDQPPEIRGREQGPLAHQA